MSKLTRRRLIAAALAAPAVVTAARAQNKRRISFTLPYLAEGSNAYAFVTRAKGYWDELGLDVAISRGFGSVAAAQAIAAGKFEFGLAVPSSAIQQAAKGLPIVAIACAGYDATMGVCVLNGSPIHSPRDIEGRKMGSVVASGEYPFLPAFARLAGFDLKAVEIVQTDPNVRQRLLTSRQVDCISGFAVSFLPPLLSQNYDAQAIPFSDYGLTLYNNALLTRPAMLANEPKLCADVAAGLLKGMKYTMLDPDDAVALFVKEVPETALSRGGVERTRIGVGIFTHTMLRDEPLSHGLGYAVPADYEEMIDLHMKYVAAAGDTTPRLGDVMSNDVIGALTLTAEELARARSNAEPFRRYLSQKYLSQKAG